MAEKRFFSRLRG